LKKRAILSILKTNVHDHTEFKLKLLELQRLVESMDYEIVETVIQQRMKKYSHFLIGKGKVDELKESVEVYNADIVIFYNVLTSKQNYNLSKVLNCEVIDRYDLILEIFAEQSSDVVSKLQIDLAQTLKNFPKYKIQAHKKYRHEHAQFRSSGEFAYHSKIRAHDKRVAKLRENLRALKERKLKQIKSRKRGQFPFKTICISGYYNAGKTTLFNALTGANKEVSMKPFTTLSSKYKRLKDRQTKILLIDTIGFVYDIDLTLINSFELQILDMQQADYVLYLIGLDDELSDLIRKFTYGLKLFQNLKIDDSKLIIVFNKVDLVSEEKIKKILEIVADTLDAFPHTFISAKSSKNLEELVNLF